MSIRQSLSALLVSGFAVAALTGCPSGTVYVDPTADRRIS